MVKPLRVLEIITVPIAENGLALYPIRMAEKMDARVQIDFLACYAEPELKTRIENRGAKLPSRAQPAAVARFVYAVCGKDRARKRLFRRTRPRKFVHACAGSDCRAKGWRENADCAQPQYLLPVSSAERALETGV